MFKTLTIVIPTYNMEQYLSQCLDSVTRKDVPNTLEVIVVNDGSTDRSLEIAKDYQAKRPDIIQIIDKPNGHYGSCINAALKIATGKYFRPLDADDWFDTDALISFLKVLEHSSIDLILTARVDHFIDRSEPAQLSNVYARTFLVNELTDNLVNGFLKIFTMHSITYKTKILIEMHLQLQEKICYTDMEYSILPLCHIQTIQYIPLSLYQYRLDRPGQSVDPTVSYNNREDLFQMHHRLLQEHWLEDCILTKEQIFQRFLYYYNTILFNRIPDKKDDENLKIIDSDLSRYHHNTKKRIYKQLFYWPLIWKLTGLHLYSFTISRMKQKFKNFVK